MNSLFLWNFKAAFHGKWIEFRDFREYSPWDDAKYIDWVRSSREGSTIMRRYREEKEWKILCVLDIRSSLLYSDGAIKKELIQDVVWLIWWASLSLWESFWGYIVSWSGNQYIRPKKNKFVIAQMQKIPMVGRGMNEECVFDFLLKKSLSRNIVFVVSDSRTPDMYSLKIAANKHDIVYVHISSSFENTLDGIWVQYLQSGNYGVAIDTGNRDKNVLYTKERKRVLDTFKKDLRKIWIDSIFVDETSSLISEFLKLMKYRERK